MKYYLQIYKGQTPSGLGQTYEVIKLSKQKHIPRIGEEIRYKFTCYTIDNVFYDLDENSVSIFVN